MYPFPRIIHLFLAAVLFGAAGALLFTQTSNEREFKPRVARISYLEGPVTTQRTTDDQWVDATLNLPLLVGDKLYTGVGGRTEVQLEDGITLRLNGDTYIHFANLEDTMIRVGLLKGSLDVNAAKVSYTRTPVEVQSKTFQAGIYEWGHVRFDADEAGNTVIMVKRGSVDIAKGAKDLLNLQRGQQARINASDPGNLIVEKIRQEDDFDQWCHMRDAMMAASQSGQYINPRVAGYSDLDRYGTWVEIPEYGRVWRPAAVVETWAPYRDGRWVWREDCGWTWVSYEPWGWVPYHYGRWVYVKRYNWCWVPGPDVYVVHHHHYHRPLWWPALVSFSYSRHGRYYSFAWGYGGYYHDYPCVGWFPLGPRDPYPHYYHFGYRRIKYENNITYIDNSYTDNSVNYYDYSTHNYQNINAPNAVTVMNKRDFDNGDFSKKAIASLNPSEIRNVTVGPEAAVQISPRRVLESKPERGGDGGSLAGPAGSMPAQTARPSETGRDLSPSRANAVVPEGGAAPTSVEPNRGLGSRAPRDEGTAVQSSASLSPARTGADQPNASGRVAQPGRETATVREEGKPDSSGSPTPGRMSLSQRRVMTQEQGNEARPETAAPSSAAPRATSPSRDETPSTSTPGAARSLSPSRAEASGTSPQTEQRASLSERRALIQDRANTDRPETAAPSSVAPRVTNPIPSAAPRSTPSYSPNRTGTSNLQPRTETGVPRSSSSNSSSYVPLSERRSVSPSNQGDAVRSNIVNQPSVRYLGPSRSSSSPSPSYSAPRSAGTNGQISPSYNAPRTNTPSTTYSAPRTYSAPQAVPRYQSSPPRVSGPSVSVPRMSAPSVGSPNVSAPRMSVPRMSAPSVNVPRLSAPQPAAPRVSTPNVSAPRNMQPQRSVSPRR